MRMSTRILSGVGLAIAAGLAPVDAKVTGTGGVTLGLSEAMCSADSCKTMAGWSCIHGEHKEQGKCDPSNCE